MKSHSKIFSTLSFALIALGLAACGSGNSSTPPTLAAPGTVGTTCGGQSGYVQTSEGELPQGSCPIGYGQVQGQYISNGQPNCLPAIENGTTNCNGVGVGIAPVNGMCTTPGTILENGLCYPEGQNGYPGGGYPGQYPGQYPGAGYPGGYGVGGGGTFGYPYGQNGGIYYGVYNYNAVNVGASRCLPGGVFNGQGCVY